jgi:hypothetical protein
MDVPQSILGAMLWSLVLLIILLSLILFVLYEMHLALILVRRLRVDVCTLSDGRRPPEAERLRTGREQEVNVAATLPDAADGSPHVESCEPSPLRATDAPKA